MSLAGATQSRYSRSEGDNGLPTDPVLSVLSTYTNLIAERDAEAEPLTEARDFQLKRVALVRDDETGKAEYVLLDGPTISFKTTHRPTRTGKFTKRTTTGAAFLDNFFSGAAEYRNSRDADVWQAGLELAQATGETRIGSAGNFSALVWPLNSAIALALIHRAGGHDVKLQDLAGRQ